MKQLDPLLRAPEGEGVGGVGDPDVGLRSLRRELVEYARHPEGSILLHGSSSSIYRLSGMPSLIVATAPSIESGRLAFAQQLESRQQARSTATLPPLVSCTAHPTNTPILSPQTPHKTVLEVVVEQQHTNAHVTLHCRPAGHVTVVSLWHRCDRIFSPPVIPR